MSEPQNKNEPSEEPVGGRNPSVPGEQPPATGELTKEEQWALFEKELKESDWGHQPC